ncbi:aromatic-ring hydroxylase C-terminal domain-containing protein [Microtetraspora niveoalba]
MAEAGAVLVPPDGGIVWRSRDAGEPGNLGRALRHVLDRP